MSVENTVMVLRPLNLIVQSLSRPYWFRIVGLVSLLLAASCSGLAFFLKRILLQKLRWWIWRVILEKDMVRNAHDEVAAMAAVSAVKAASSAAAQVARLSQVMLTVQAEEKHRTKNFVSALQAVSLKLTTAELIMRGFVDEMDRRKKLSATNGIPLSWHSIDKRYNLQGNLLENIQSAWKAPSSNANWVSNTRGKLVETPQPTIQNGTPQSASFLEVMAMLERGETPPGIKKINDKPPIPNQLPSVSCLQPKPKPWETEDRGSTSILKVGT